MTLDPNTPSILHIFFFHYKCLFLAALTVYNELPQRAALFIQERAWAR